MTKDEPPVEMFKRATAACFRALAERADMDVSYSAEAPGVSGEKVRLPFPSRELPREEVAQVRGEADALALRLKHHDAKQEQKSNDCGQIMSDGVIGMEWNAIDRFTILIKVFLNIDAVRVI